MIEFMIQFLLPAIKCKPVEANEYEGCEVSGREVQMRNSVVVILLLMNEIANASIWLMSPRLVG